MGVYVHAGVSACVHACVPVAKSGTGVIVDIVHGFVAQHGYVHKRCSSYVY